MMEKSVLFGLICTMILLPSLGYLIMSNYDQQVQAKIQFEKKWKEIGEKFSKEYYTNHYNLVHDELINEDDVLTDTPYWCDYNLGTSECEPFIYVELKDGRSVVLNVVQTSPMTKSVGMENEK